MTPARLAATALTAAVTLAPSMAPSLAHAQDRCISRADSQAVVAYLMPDLVDRAAKRCAPLLGQSYLGDRGGALAERMSPLSRAAWPDARRALERQSGTSLPDGGILVDIGRAAIADGITQELDRESCEVLDQMLIHLEPLPPENLANVFALFLEAGMNNDPDAALRVCPVG